MVSSFDSLQMKASDSWKIQGLNCDYYYEHLNDGSGYEYLLNNDSGDVDFHNDVFCRGGPESGVFHSGAFYNNLLGCDVHHPCVFCNNNRLYVGDGESYSDDNGIFLQNGCCE